MNNTPTQSQQSSTELQNIDAEQLDAILGGCACGCEQTSCNCANGSCSTSASALPGATTQRPFGW
jgi:hypothetical protein